MFPSEVLEYFTKDQYTLDCRMVVQLCLCPRWGRTFSCSLIRSGSPVSRSTMWFIVASWNVAPRIIAAMNQVSRKCYMVLTKFGDDRRRVYSNKGGCPPHRAGGRSIISTDQTVDTKEPSDRVIRRTDWLARRPTISRRLAASSVHCRFNPHALCHKLTYVSRLDHTIVYKLTNHRAQAKRILSLSPL